VPDKSPPAIDSASNNCGCQEQNSHDQSHRNPERRWGNAIFEFLRVFLCLLVRVRAMCQVVLGKKRFFIEAEIVGNRANEAAVEDAAGKLVPLFVFERSQKTGADARCLSDFLQRDFAQFPFAF